MSEQHLDLFPVLARLTVFGGLGHGASDVACCFIKAASDLAKRHVRAATRLKRARHTIGLPGPINDGVGFSDVCTRITEGAPFVTKRTPLRAAVLASVLVPSKVAVRERAIVALRFVPHRNMRFDLLVVDQPSEHGTCSVRGVADQARGFDTELLFNPINHRFSGHRLFGPMGCRRLYIDNDTRVHVHQVIG